MRTRATDREETVLSENRVLAAAHAAWPVASLALTSLLFSLLTHGSSLCGLPEAHPHPRAFAQAVPSAGNVSLQMSQSLCKCHLLRKIYLKFQPWEGNTQCNIYVPSC